MRLNEKITLGEMKNSLLDDRERAENLLRIRVAVGDRLLLNDGISDIVNDIKRHAEVSRGQAANAQALLTRAVQEAISNQYTKNKLYAAIAKLLDETAKPTAQNEKLFFETNEGNENDE